MTTDSPASTQQKRCAQELYDGILLKSVFEGAPRQTVSKYVLQKLGSNDHQFLEDVTDELTSLLNQGRAQ